jgi:tRNA(Leu) C34 or U34 (ribose-2'-O)-methylase TrmL
VANLLIHVEQHDVVGVLPSQLESLALLATAMGVGRTAFVDATSDGVRRSAGFERYASLEAWLDQVEGPIIAFTPDGETDIRELRVSDDAWLVFGPSMGLRRDALGDRVDCWASVPGGVLNSRDAAVIAVWEVSSWRAP